MDKNWTIIFSCGNLQKAELIKNLLEYNEIYCILINHQDLLYKFGEIEIYVNRNDAVKAKYVLTENNTS
jgi:Putative prokaryotic signal transducing protein